MSISDLAFQEGVPPDIGVSAIEASGVLGEFTYSLDFGTPEHPKSTRVIYAENGMGKTTFLRAVYHLLTPEVESLLALSEIGVESMKITLRSGATVHFLRPDPILGVVQVSIITGDQQSADGRVGLLLEEDDLRAIRRAGARPEILRYFSRLRHVVSPTVLVGDDRLIYSPLDASSATAARYRDEREARLRHRTQSSSNVRDSLDQVEKALTRMALAGISSEKADANSGVYLAIARSILGGTENRFLATQARADLLEKATALLSASANYEKYGLIALGQVRNIVEEIDNNRANSARFRSLHSVLDPYLSNLLDEVESLESAQKRIDTFVTSVNRFLERKELRYTTYRGITLVGRNDDVLDPDSLSSGEKHLLLLLSNAILATFTGSLVIIDEPELSLGLKWQRLLLSELSRCTEGSGVQFLIASHSVQIMADIEDLVSPTEAVA